MSRPNWGCHIDMYNRNMIVGTLCTIQGASWFSSECPEYCQTSTLTGESDLEPPGNRKMTGHSARFLWRRNNRIPWADLINKRLRALHDLVLMHSMQRLQIESYDAACKANKVDPCSPTYWSL